MGNRFIVKSFLNTGENGETKLKYREFIDWIAENKLNSIDILQEHRGIWGTTLEDLSNHLNDTDTNFINLVFSSLLNLKDLRNIFLRLNYLMSDISSKASDEILNDQDDFFNKSKFKSKELAGITKAIMLREDLTSCIQLMLDIQAVFKATEKLFSIELLNILPGIDPVKTAENLPCIDLIVKIGYERPSFKDVKHNIIKPYTEDLEVNTYINHLNRFRSNIIEHYINITQRI